MITDHKVGLDPTIFRTYDIRGIAGKSLSDNHVFLIGKALGSLIQERGERLVVLARDGRISSPVLAPALTEGLLSSGCDVINLGMSPTPLLYFAIEYFNAKSGVMLTGSHNPSDYNGIKAVVNRKSLTADEIQSLYHRIINRELTSGRGVLRVEEIFDDYIKAICKDIKLAKPLKIVVDAGNGVTGSTAPYLYRTLGCEVHELFCNIDGRFPNHHADPSQIENLQDLIAKVKEVNADIGLAFDGDGDRLGVVTNKGTVIWADRTLMLFAREILSENPNSSVIFDVKCTDHLSALVKKLGGIPVMWKTGHSLIKEKVAETQALLAGEMSGHFIFKDRWNGFDDALYAGARLLEICAKATVDTETLFASIPNSTNTPELKVSVPDTEKFALMDELIAKADFKNAKEIMTIDGLRVSFDRGWGLVRPSNTTPYLIIRFEAIDEPVLKSIQDTFKEWILSVRPELELPF